MNAVSCRRRRGPFTSGRGARAVLCGGLCMLVVFSGCSGPGESPRTDVAVVNGEKIYLKDFNRELARARKLSDRSATLAPEEMRRLQEEVLNGLINKKVMFRRARELGVSVNDDELMQRIREIKKDYSNSSFDELLAAEKIDFALWREELRSSLLLEKLIAVDVDARIMVTEEEMKEYYQAHRNDYTAKKRVRVAQIIVRDRGKAEEIGERLKRGEDFGVVAREVSIGPEAAAGGDLGFFGRGVMPEAIDKAVFSLAPGRISRIVKSPYGYHIFKVLARDEGGRQRFEAVKGEIVADIKKQREEKAYTDWLAGLRTRAVVKRNEELLKKISAPTKPSDGQAR